MQREKGKDGKNRSIKGGQEGMLAGRGREGEGKGAKKAMVAKNRLGYRREEEGMGGVV